MLAASPRQTHRPTDRAARRMAREAEHAQTLYQYLLGMNALWTPHQESYPSISATTGLTVEEVSTAVHRLGHRQIITCTKGSRIGVPHTYSVIGTM